MLPTVSEAKRAKTLNRFLMITKGVIKMDIVDIVGQLEQEDGFEFILLLGRGNVCHFLVLQTAEQLECKATEAISPTAARKPPRNCYRSLRGFASSACSKTVLFFCQCNSEHLAWAQSALCLLLCGDE